MLERGETTNRFRVTANIRFCLEVGVPKTCYNKVAHKVRTIEDDPESDKPDWNDVLGWGECQCPDARGELRGSLHG